MADLRISAGAICQIAQIFFSDKIHYIEPIEGGFDVSIKTNYPPPARYFKAKLLFDSFKNGVIHLKIDPYLWGWLKKIIEFIINNSIPSHDIVKVNGSNLEINVSEIQIKGGRGALKVEDIQIHGDYYIIAFKILTYS